MIEQFYDLRPEVLALDRKALDLCRAQFAHVEEIRDYNQLKMLRAFTDCGVEARHFWGSSGYGVWDDSRNKLEEVFARCMGAEAALVNGQWRVTKALMSRSARTLMEGWVRVPPTP